jgi:hypothetical protein
MTTDPRTAFSFSGEHNGVRFSCVPHRYGKGMVLTLHRDARDMFKDRASWLAEALGARWARGHQEGHRIAPTKAALWHKLFLSGWEGTCSVFGRNVEGYPYFTPPEGGRLTFREMKKRISP